MEVILARGQVRVDSGVGPIPALDQFENNAAQEGKRDRSREGRGKSGCGNNVRYRLFVVAI